MKKFALSMIAVMALSSNVMAGSDTIVPLVAPVIIENDDETADGLYVGLAYTHMSHDLDFRGSTTNVELDYHTIMINLGYKFNPYIAIEGRYHVSLEDNDMDDYTENSDITILSLYVKPMYPISPEMDIYALLGYSMTDASNDSKVTSVDESAFSWGAGASYVMTEDFTLFADYTQYYNDTLNNFDHVIDSFNLGVTYTF